jgi:1,4-alpha-glucan branching enzyme
MTKNRKHKPKDNSQAAQPVQVEFSHPTANAVAIAGTFNDWRPDLTPMVSVGNGRWVKELALRPGVYEYQWVVDGEWIPELFVEVVA